MFTGRRFDLETGLYYYRARYYNPYIGRFLQTDPIGSGYNYCGNNPLNFVDPSGCHRVDRYYHFHFFMPAEIIDYDADSLGEANLIQKTRDWFERNRILSWHPGWVINDIKVGTFQDGSKSLELIIYYMDNFGPLWDPPPDQWPSLSYEYVNILKDTSGTDTTVVDRVPLLKIDSYTVIDWKAIERIIKPAIQEINGWYNGRKNWVLSGYFRNMYYNLKYEWDSWFWNQKKSTTGRQFLYAGRIYSGADINYIVGGAAFAHYGWSPEASLAAFHSWKLCYGHLPGDINCEEALYWFGVGYSNYARWEDW